MKLDLNLLAEHFDLVRGCFSPGYDGLSLHRGLVLAKAMRLTISKEILKCFDEAHPDVKYYQGLYSVQVALNELLSS